MKVTLLAVLVGLLLLATWGQAQSGPPAICKPCLYYSGDLSPSDPSAEVFLNEETISTAADTFGAVLVPQYCSVLVEGLLFQTVIEAGDKLDPKEAFYQIRTNITEEGGTLVASGGGRRTCSRRVVSLMATWNTPLRCV
jgi:hypothetical protein